MLEEQLSKARHDARSGTCAGLSASNSVMNFSSLSTAALLAPLAQSGRWRAAAMSTFTLGLFFCTKLESW